MALGSRIRYYRDKTGLTLDQLSERSGVDVGTISALEVRDSQRSKYAPSIARAFGLSVEQLVDESRDWLEPATAAAEADEESRAAALKDLVLADVLRHASSEERRRVLDDIRMVVVKGRARFKAEEFHRTLDLIDKIDQDAERHK